MARPTPIIILEDIDKSYISHQVVESEGIFAVFYEQKPINLRMLNSLVNYPGPKYKKVSFSNPGHAFNLAERLNTRFKTDKFEVYKMTAAIKATETKIGVFTEGEAVVAFRK